MLDGVFSDRSHVARKAFTSTLPQGLIHPVKKVFTIGKSPTVLHASKRIGILNILTIGCVGHRLQNVLTSGSILALRFGQDIPIVEEFYAAGSLGSFNLQFNVTLQNYTLAAQQVELVLMCVNSGLFITSQGVSSTYTGILTKSDVLAASEMKPVSERHLRLVGGVESSALNSVADIAPKAQDAIMDAVSAAKSSLAGKGESGIGGRMKLASRC